MDGVRARASAWLQKALVALKAGEYDGDTIGRLETSMTKGYPVDSAGSIAPAPVPTLKPPRWFWLWDVAAAALAGWFALLCIGHDQAGMDGGFASLISGGIAATVSALWVLGRNGATARQLSRGAAVRTHLALSATPASAFLLASALKRVSWSLLPFSVSVPVCMAAGAYLGNVRGLAVGETLGGVVVQTMVTTAIAFLPTIVALGAALRWLVVYCKGRNCSLPDMLAALGAFGAVFGSAFLLAALFPLALIILPLSVWLLASSWKAACKALYEFD
jgi:hypothetical protein